MKKLCQILCIIILFANCKEDNKQAVNFSKLIEYQYLIQNNSQYDLEIETYKIRYRSDGLEITGYISKPKNELKYPTIIYNRGGNRDFGTHGFKSLLYQQFLASNGFIVLSSQLRGNMFSEGVDEFGGSDLNDILKLIEIARSLTFSNKKIGVYGISRGGLNTYQISRISDDISAIAVVGAITDPRLDLDIRPGMYEGVYKELFGDTINNKEAYDYRSPLVWADEINEPTLILHGANDWRVKPINAHLMVEKMKSLDKELEYHIMEKGDHGLNTHEDLRNEKVINWFKKYLE